MSTQNHTAGVRHVITENERATVDERVFAYASHIYYAHESGLVFSSHVDDLDANTPVTVPAFASTVPQGARPHKPIDPDEDDIITVWTDRCDAVVARRTGGLN